MFNKNQEKIAEIILKCFDFDGPYKFKLHEKNPDAPLSPNKVNLRVKSNGGVLTLSDVRKIILAWYPIIDKLGISYDAVVGMPYSGEPFASVFYFLRNEVYKVDTGILTLVKTQTLEKREITGTREIINCPLGSELLAFEETMTEGNSSIEGYNVVRNNGWFLRNFVILVDREQGGKERLEKLGISVYPLFKLTELLEYYFSKGMISQKNLDDHKNYLEAHRKFRETNPIK